MKRVPLTRKTELGRKPPSKASSKRRKQGVPSVAVLDDLFSRYIRRFGECQLWKVGGIPCSQQMHCSHIHSRVYQSVRWDPMNALCVCAAHHRWQHNHPTLNTWALEEILGKPHLEALRDTYLQGRKPTPEQKIGIANFLRQELAKC